VGTGWLGAGYGGMFAVLAVKGLILAVASGKRLRGER
jgi:hypothetical protein